MSALAPKREIGRRIPLEKLRYFAGEFSRYFLVSLIAMSVDFGVLVLLKEEFGVYYLVASALSYTLGSVLHYALSIRFVFHRHRLKNRTVELITFVLLGFLGLAATQIVLALAVGVFGLNYIAGKVVAAAVSFVVNYAARRTLLFSIGRRQP